MSLGPFDSFVAERSTALLRTAYLLTGDRGPALDLLQTAMLAVSRRADRIADREEATAAVRRELVAALTGRLRRLDVGDLLADSSLLAGTASLPGFASPTADPGPRDELTAALLRLPPRMRAALVLHHGEGLSAAATADALGRPVEAAQDQLRLGLARLRRLLDETGPASSTDDDALVQRLRLALVERAAGAPAAPGDTWASVLDGARTRRRHLAGLVALGAFVAVVVLLVAVGL